MTEDEKILLGLKGLGETQAGTFFAFVENNYPEKEYIDVRDLNGTLYTEVRKRAAIENDVTGIIITPVINSSVIVSRISGSDELFIEMFSQVESIVINGGNNGGLIKIQELTNKINALVKSVNDLVGKYNSHTHTVNTTGTSSAQSGIAAATISNVQTAKEFKVEEYENSKIQH